MSWEKVRLGDIAEFSNGINFGKDDYGKGIKIIGVSNFGDKFSPEYDSLTEVKEEVVICKGRKKNTDFVVSVLLTYQSTKEKHFIQSILFCQFSAGKSESRTFPLTVLA